VEFNSGNDSQTLAPFELMTEVPDELAHILKTDFPVYFCARPGNVLLIVKVSGSYYQKAFDIDSWTLLLRLGKCFMNTMRLFKRELLRIYSSRLFIVVGKQINRITRSICSPKIAQIVTPLLAKSILLRAKD
jgi:hypothetical protein